MAYRALPAGSAYHPFASATLYLKKFRQWIYKAPCANTQGTTTSTLHVSIPELTTSQPPSTEAKNANVQRGPMNDTLSCPGIALYAHERRRHDQSSGISIDLYEVPHITFDFTYLD
ncbi:hypothetical protein BTUL_0012g00380 [Botrytis tulipae]|uniref:Uncharacterized protein n=1 Tax=Botrytis tulipae TaxID=87230 RepID=A0A4Z1F0K6_9HELO|nr:hypothetical protein BTUL_0012g00380 [Botrytis tulipae]